MPRARGARHEFPFAIAQRREERAAGGGGGVGLVKSRLCAISDVFAAPLCEIRKVAPVPGTVTFLVTLSARGHADKKRACSARPDFFAPRSQLVSSYFNCGTRRVHVMKLRRAKNEIQSRKLSFFAVTR